MKKSLLILMCFALWSIGANSQGFGKKLLGKMEFGLKAGANYNDFTDAGFATDPLVGFHGGVTVAYKFTDNLMIQQELLFSTQGAKVLSGPLGAQDLKLSYFSIPLLIKYRSEFGFYGEIGGQVSFKIDEQVANFSGTDFAKKLDYGAIAGLGYQTKMGLGIGARYVYGLEKISDVNIGNLGGEMKNNSIQASLFFIF